MDTSDATAFAREQMVMEMEDGGVMTLKRLARVAAEWSTCGSDQADILTELWNETTSE